MKKVMLLLVISLMLVGCAKQQYVCPDGSLVNDAEKCMAAAEKMAEDMKEAADKLEDVADDEPVFQEPETKDTPGETKEVEDKKPVAEAADLPKEVSDVFAKADGIDSVSYTYYGPETRPAAEEVMVMGDDIKIQLLVFPNRYVLNEIAEQIYLNKKTKQIGGYCDPAVNERCDELVKFTDVKFEDYDRMTPFDWIDKVKSVDEIIGDGLVEGRTVLIFTTTIDDQPVKYFVDQYSGLPVRVLFNHAERDEEDRTDYEYKTIVLNGVYEEDVTPPEV